MTSGDTEAFLTRMTKPIFESDHLLLLSRHGWDYVERKRGKSAVAVIAETADGRLILVEQFRHPMDAPVIDWPAGLVGDQNAGESPEAAARKELEEEAGYTCETLERLAFAATSPGITSETVTLYRARGVRRIGEGGGVGNEKIVVHLVSGEDLARWLKERESEGRIIDLKVWAGLYFVAGRD